MALCSSLGPDLNRNMEKVHYFATYSLTVYALVSFGRKGTAMQILYKGYGVRDILCIAQLTVIKYFQESSSTDCVNIRLIFR